MRQIVNIEKEIAFKTMLGDITSISLEEDLSFINDSEIEGNLIVSGTYRMTEASTLEEDFNYKVPVEIMLTSNLDEDKRKVAINNFTYKIVNEEALLINVELLIEGLEKIDVEEDTSDLEDEKTDDNDTDIIDTLEEETLKEEVRGDSDMNEEEVEVLSTDLDDDTLPSLSTVDTIDNTNTVDSVDTVNNNESKEVMNSIFTAFANTDETYATYSVYILRENEMLDDAISKYKITKEDLEEYNDLDNLRVGSKLIIPCNLDTNE